MQNTKLNKFWDTLWMVQKARYQLMSLTIIEAVTSGIHVEIIVSSEPGTVLAWKLWEVLGFPEGSSEFTHVTIDTIQTDNMWSRGEGLSIQYSNIVKPGRM
jgi:hypothetical protein